MPDVGSKGVGSKGLKTTEGIFADVAAIIVADPCRVMPKKAYERMIEDRLDRERDPKSPLILPDYGILVPTVENCDGWVGVRVEHDKAGWPRRLIINLDTKVKKPGGETR